MARITSMKYITFLFLCTLVLFSKYVVMGLKHDAKSISKNSNVVSINSNNKNNNNNNMVIVIKHKGNLLRHGGKFPYSS